MPSFISLGDQAQHFALRQRNAMLQRTADRLLSEVTTGRRADAGLAMAGDFSGLSAIERSLALISTYRQISGETAARAAGMQASLDGLGAIASLHGATLLATTTTATSADLRIASQAARADFDAAVGLLNAEAAGRSLFAGAATDREPLAPSHDIFTAIAAAAAGQTTAAGIEATVTAWFDAPPGGGGYLDVAYRGSLAASPATETGPGTIVTLPATAADAAPRALLKGLALAALVGAGALPADTTAQRDLLERAGRTIIGAGDGLVSQRAAIGIAERRIETGKSLVAAEAGALEIRKAEILGIDPYDSASRLQDITSRIETLYTLTARMSALSLTRFLG